MPTACNLLHPIPAARAALRTCLLAVAALTAVPASAQDLSGTATVEMDIQVVADDVFDQLAEHRARIEAGEAERRELRDAVRALQGQPGIDDDPGSAPPAAAGFTVFAPSPDTRTVYVAAHGSDRNHGLTPDAPLRTARAGYAKLRDGFPDRLLFRAGDTFAGNLGNLTKSGRNPAHPQVIGVYGTGDRPMLLSPDSTWARKEFKASANFVAFQGLHLVASQRKAAAATGDAALLNENQWKQSALSFLGHAEGILVEDCKLEAFKFALVFQSDANWGHQNDITLRRNIVVDSYGHWDKKIGGHSSGIYAQYVDGLTIEENVWDRNGWNDKVRGAKRTKFNHNLYCQTDLTGNTTVRGNIISRASAHGLQLRAGGNVTNNLFVQNPLAFYVGRYPSIVADNVVLQSIDMSDDRGESRGQGIGVNPCLAARVHNNVVSQKQGTFKHAAAIHADWAKKGMGWLGDRGFRVSVYDNKVFNWPYVMDKPGEAHAPDTHEALGIKINKAATLDRFENNHRDHPRWVDPQRDVESYMESLGRPATFAAFIEAARNRPRGTWDPVFSAAAVNDYVRAGFEYRD